MLLRARARDRLPSTGGGVPYRLSVMPAQGGPRSAASDLLQLSALAALPGSLLLAEFAVRVGVALRAHERIRPTYDFATLIPVMCWLAFVGPWLLAKSFAMWLPLRQPATPQVV